MRQSPVLRDKLSSVVRLVTSPRPPSTTALFSMMELNFAAPSVAPLIRNPSNNSDAEDGEICTNQDVRASRYDESDTDVPTSTQQDVNEDDIPIARLFSAHLHTISPHNDARSISFPTALPSFAPLQIAANRSTRAGRPNLHNIRNPHSHTPLGMFSMFVPSSVLAKIFKRTNMYAVSKGAGSGRA